MITGFNTDVDYDGLCFHVQTEDKGRKNPLVESLVYCGGEILTKIRTPYEELAASSDYSEEAVIRVMEEQHKTLVREIQNGKFDPDGPKPVGYNIITNRSLDQVVIDFLSTELVAEPIRLEIENHQVFYGDTSPTVTFRVLSEASGAPVPSIKIAIKLISTAQRPREIFSGSTDVQGKLEATFEIPAAEEDNMAILCQAEAPGYRSELKQLVRTAAEEAS